MSKEPPESSDADLPHFTVADVSGTVVFDSNLVMHGEMRVEPQHDVVVVGSLDCTAIRGIRNLAIPIDGVVSGIVQGETAEIAGTLNGTAEISDTVILRRTAQLSGEVCAQRIRVEEGTNLEHCVLSGSISRAESP